MMRPCLLFGVVLLGIAAWATPTYRSDIAPLLAKHCLNCHRPGGPGRIALDSYAQVRRYAPEISNAVATRDMPLARHVHGVGEFRNATTLTHEEIARIIEWVDSGTPEGSGPDALPEAPRSRSDWPLGNPDLVVSPEASFSVTATGRPETRCFAIPIDLPEAHFIRAIDIRPENGRVALYARVFADVNGIGRRLDADDPRPGFDCFVSSEGILDRWSLGEWSAAFPAESLPAGSGRLLPARTGLVVEVRYHHLGFAVSDRSQVGVYFQSGPVTRIIRTHSVANRDLIVPAGEWAYPAHAEWQIVSPIEVISIAPHMNASGAEMKVRAYFPDGNQRELLWIREWDRNQQMGYALKTPLRLPAGSRIEARAIYNNSSDNDNLPPGPLRTRSWGWGEHDERLVAFVEYLEVDE